MRYLLEIEITWLYSETMDGMGYCVSVSCDVAGPKAHKQSQLVHGDENLRGFSSASWLPLKEMNRAYIRDHSKQHSRRLV